MTAAIAIGLVGASLGAAGTWMAFRSGTAAEPAAATRLTLETPVTAPLRSGGGTLALSPDGSTLVYVAATDGSQLYVRSFDAFEPRPLEGTQGAWAPFFSPDGKSIAFFADGMLKRIPTIGGPTTKICEMPENTGGGSGGTWGPGDVIVFAVSATARAGLFRVSAGGGVPDLVVKPDPKDEGGLRDPAFIPGTLAIVFATDRPKAGVAPSILVRSLDSGQQRTLVPDASRPMVTTSGHLLYFADAAVHARPFSVAKLDVSGPAVPVIDNVSSFDISASGRIVYTTTSSPGGAGHLVWVDRHGTETPLRHDALYSRPRLSPDNSKLVMEIVDGTKSDIGVLTFSSTTVHRLTSNGNGNSPYWHPDGKRVVFRSSGKLVIQSADGTGTAGVFLDSADRALSQTSSLAPGAFSRDGSLYAFVVHGSGGTAADIWTLREGPDRSIQPLVQGRGNQWGVRISPDDRWVSYASHDGLRFELNVSALPPGGGRFQVSSQGGEQGVWSPTGHELFYRVGDRMMAVPYVPGAERPFGKPQEVFQRVYQRTDLPNYDVTRDGKRFVMVKAVKPVAGDAERRVIRVIDGFFDELKRRAPVGGSAR
jgi:serine/threonine-protein kinase